MNEEREKRDRSLQHEAEHAKPHKRVSVMGYLTILFAAAFLLMLLTYFMQQRSSEQTINGLTDSVETIQSVGDLLDQNKALHEEQAALTGKVGHLEDELAAANAAAAKEKERADTLTRQAQSLDWLWRIQRAYSRGNRGSARALIDQFEASQTSPDLPTEDLTGQGGPTPAEQYQSLLSALNYQPAEP